MSNLSKVIVGGPIVFSPEVLGEVLRGSCLYASYKDDAQTLELSHNNGGGGSTIFLIKNISHESAAKLAKGMGLKADKDNDSCCHWGRHVPMIHLCHDGSEDAERIRLEACRLNMECRVIEIGYHPWHVHQGMYRYEPDYWPADKVIKEMQKWAEWWHLKSYLKKAEVSA